jgi:hypothetical protein
MIPSTSNEVRQQLRPILEAKTKAEVVDFAIEAFVRLREGRNERGLVAQWDRPITTANLGADRRNPVWGD